MLSVLLFFSFLSIVFSKLQWHLKNSRFPGNDVNVLPVWKEGVTGKGVTVCIIDDGIDFDHPDLKSSLRPDLSKDFNALVSDRLPTPQVAEDCHGTRCAGQIAASPSGICGGSGVAPGASISAIRLLGGQINAQKEAAAITFRNDANDIYSCSWGPSDDGKSVEGPDYTVLKAFISGLLDGRNGRGSIFVFAAGNGQLGKDNCNYDGYANGAFSLTIGAISADNSSPYYMEECAAMLAVTYSSGGLSKSDRSVPKISTVDINGGCTDKHGGTSAAAPLAAGIMALALSVRPELTWRDMQHLLVTTAVPFNLDDHSWFKNGVNRLYSTRFGYGKIDAHRLVTAARDVQLKAPPKIRSLPWIVVKRSIEAASEGVVSSSFSLDYDLHWNYFELAEIAKLERVSVSVQVQHGRRGDLVFKLCSPSGTCVPLTSPRPLDDDSESGLMGWTFSTVAFWDEIEILGTWTIHVINRPREGSQVYSGQFIQWRLTLWGESTHQVKFSKSQFAMDFLNNFFPPTSDYFTDHQAVWQNPKNLNLKNQKYRNSSAEHFKKQKMNFLLFFSLLFMTFSLLFFFIFNFIF